MSRHNKPLIPPFPNAEAPDALWQFITTNMPTFADPECQDQILVITDEPWLGRLEEFAEGLRRIATNVSVGVLSFGRRGLDLRELISRRIVIAQRTHVTGFRMPNLKSVMILGPQKGIRIEQLIQATARSPQNTLANLIVTHPKQYRELGLEMNHVVTTGMGDRLVHWHSTDPYRLSIGKFFPDANKHKQPTRDALAHPLRKALIPLFEDLSSTDVMPIVQATFEPDLENEDWDFLDRIVPHKYSTYVLIAVIRSLYKFRSEIPTWYTLRDNVAQHFNDTGLNAERLMRGLFND